MILKIIITESQYRKLFNNPDGVIFGDIDEGRKKMTQDEFLAKVPKEFRNSDDSLKYTYSEFSGMDKPITIYCPKEGHRPTEIPQAGSHIQGTGCKECNREERKDEFFAKVPKEFRNSDGSLKYTYSEFSGTKKPITIYCKKHDESRDLSQAIHHFQGTGCKECNREKWKDKFIKDAQKIHIDDKKNPIYIYDPEKLNYVNTKTEVTITCPKDGHGDFPQTPNNHLQGKGCPKCSESKGEKVISNFLVKKYGNNVNSQMTFSDCTNAHKGPQRCFRYKFDFYVPEINTIIEYDGVQHFNDIKYFHRTDDSFYGGVKDDIYKNNYCKKKKIKMIRISYNEKDIIEQLEKGLESKDMLWLSDNYPKLGWNK